MVCECKPQKKILKKEKLQDAEILCSVGISPSPVGRNGLVTSSGILASLRSQPNNVAHLHNILR